LATLELTLKRLVIRLLGGFEAVLDGNPLVGFESDKVRALLAYLVMYAGWSQRREKLTGLLWPDSPESAARASLRNALANLRQAIGDRQAKSPFLCVTRQAITLEGAGDYWLDVADFEQAFQNNTTSLDGDRLHLEKAISLYRGPLLDGFSVASITFQDWLLLERERLNRQMVDALCRLTLCYAEEGLLEKALHHAWRQVELEPWEEKGQRLLIGLLAASGRRGEALAQYDHCCQMLRETLDVEPSGETVALHYQILAGEVPIPSSRPPPAR
jgi:DNA-binding SARP family transcriptional activator